MSPSLADLVLCLFVICCYLHAISSVQRESIDNNVPYLLTDQCPHIELCKEQEPALQHGLEVCSSEHNDTESIKSAIVIDS